MKKSPKIRQKQKTKKKQNKNKNERSDFYEKLQQLKTQKLMEINRVGPDTFDEGLSMNINSNLNPLKKSTSSKKGTRAG